MFERHVHQQLARYLDGELPAAEASRLERHVALCEKCRVERDQVRSGVSMLNELPLAHAPDAIWLAIDASLETPPRRSPFRYWIPAMAALLVIIAAVVYWARRPQAHWTIVALQGSTAIDAKPIEGSSTVSPGNWIETAPSSRAKVQIGAIGVVDIEPGTRLRVVAAQPNDHRLTLARGEIHARISAPPRLFFVDTASVTAADLGCEYSLKTDEDGTGLLQVTLGWVSLESKGLQSLVPAGASCRTRPRSGPDIPYFDDAPEEIVHAAETPLDDVLRHARVRDTLTLWHLLARTTRPDRDRIFERIAELTPVPPDISREQILQLDPAALNRWKEALAWTW